MLKALLSDNKKASKLIQVDLYTPFWQQYQFMTAGGFIDVFPGRPFRILIAHASSSVINLAQNQRVAIRCLPPLEVNHNKNDEPFLHVVLQPISDYVNVVHYRPGPTVNRKFINMSLSNNKTINPSTTIAVRKWRLATDTRITCSSLLRGYKNSRPCAMDTSKNINFKEPFSTILWRCPICAPCVLSSRTKHQTTHCKRDGQNTEWGHHTTLQNRVGDHNILCLEIEILLSFYIDRRRLNAVAVRDFSLYPHMDE